MAFEGLSISTVSRALNHIDISEKLKSRLKLMPLK
jgi:DNA-binding LacI/PurR family transcriptional regulator